MIEQQLPSTTEPDHEHGRRDRGPPLHAGRPAGHARWEELRAGRWPTGGAKHGSRIEWSRNETSVSRLDRFCEEHGLGIVWPADNGYQCFPHAPGLVRRPDVSFIRRGRLPGDVSPEGWVRIPPDLAVEVVSPNDSAEELEEKLDDYRKAGVPLVWVIYPKARKARVFRLRRPDRRAGGGRRPLRRGRHPRLPLPPARDPAAAHAGR